MASYSIYSKFNSSVLKGVAGLAFNSNGTLFCSSVGNDTVYQISTSGIVSNFITSGNNLISFPQGLAFNSSGTLFCACQDTNSIVQIGTSGNVTSFSIDPSNLLLQPLGLAFNSNGTLFCSSYNSTTVVQIDTSGNVTPFADDVLLTSPTGLAFNSNGNLFCGSQRNKIINKIDASGGVTQFTTNTDKSLIGDITGLTFEPSTKDFYSLDNTDNTIVRINSFGLVFPFIDASTNDYFKTIKAYNSYLYFSGSIDVNTSGNVWKTDDPVCFNHDTTILCLNHLLEEEYIPIQDLKKGDFVKTYLHGYRKIEYLYKSRMVNNPNQWKKCMYKMEKTEENELLEDLIVTGGHAIMVDSISEVEQERYNKLGLPNFVEENKIDDKYLLLSSVSEQFIPLTDTNTYTIYHFCLENNEDDNARYGVWANGILTETPSKHYLI